MGGQNQITRFVVSASRRTDIPAFYMKWFMESITRGYFEVVNPYNRKVSLVDASPSRVHTIVFWSKNFGPFLHGKYGEKLKALGYHLFFNFTINSVSKVLEPGVPPLALRMKQLFELAETFGAPSINWRFDPICHFTDSKGRIQNNLEGFTDIAEEVSQCGIKRCITSFADDYRKIKQRASDLPGFSLVDPPMERKVDMINRMEAVLKNHDISLHTCCENQVLEQLPEGTTVSPSACIDSKLLMELHGGKLSLAKDRGQRVASGCGCSTSVDIGSYNLHPCYHNCRFCYANPAPPGAKQSARKKHTDLSYGKTKT